MCLYWLARHTKGENWETVEQLVHRENTDRWQAAACDGYTPIAFWEERVAVARKEIKQVLHLAKAGTALGPDCRALPCSPPAPLGAGASAVSKYLSGI